MLAIRQSALGHVRYVLKDGLKWLPLYGWYFSQVICPCEYLLLAVVNICMNLLPHSSFHYIVFSFLAWWCVREKKCKV